MFFPFNLLFTSHKKTGFNIIFTRTHCIQIERCFVALTKADKDFSSLNPL